MGSLLTSLLNSANTIRVMDRELDVLQNNVANANTPGFVRQTQTIHAQAFELESGLPGGVAPGDVISARSEYAEQAVRTQVSLSGSASQRSADLAQIEPVFDLQASYGIAGSLNDFFQSFSQLGVNPNDSIARQDVLDAAGNLASSFQSASAGLKTASANAQTEIRNVVDGINRLAAQIRTLNESRKRDFRAGKDAGLDAQMHANLEELAQLTDFTVIQDPDGSINIDLGGRTPLVIGDKQYPIRADFSTGSAVLRDADGNDITTYTHAGTLSALIEEQNTTIPSYMADLDRLATGVADAVNLQLQAGLDSSGASPTIDLFTYNATMGAASSLALTAIAPSQLAAASPGAPGGNGNALALAALASAKTLDGFTFTQYYGNLAGRVGRDLSSAKEDAQTQESLVTQARSMRASESAVSLDEEAMRLIQIQRQYEATGKLMSVLNDITDTLISILR